MLLFSLLCVPVLLALSALFSGTETAVFAYDRLEAEQIARSGRGPLSTIFRRPDLFLATVLLLNLAANAGLNVLLAYVTTQVAGEAYLPLLAVVTTALILLCSEITPKIAAVKYAKKLAPLGAIPLFSAMTLLRPLMAGMVAACQWIRRRAPWKPVPYLMPEELRSAVAEAIEAGELSPAEGKVLDNMIVFRERPLREFMTPRTEIVFLPRTTPPEEIPRRMRQARFARLPVTDGNDIDTVIGCIYVKEVLLAESPDLERLLHPVYFAPECMHAGDLFRELIERAIQLAMVVDEYGDIVGLVSVHDLIEELMGENPDEYSPPDPWVARKVHDGWIINASVPVETVNQRLGLNLPVGRERTLGGFLFNLFGHLPKRGESVRWGPWRFTVQVVRRKRIAVVKLTKALNATGKSTGEGVGPEETTGQRKQAGNLSAESVENPEEEQ